MPDHRGPPRLLSPVANHRSIMVGCEECFRVVMHPATSSSKHVMQRARVTTPPRLPRVWPYATNRSDLARGARTASIAPGRRPDRESSNPRPAENSRARPRSTGGLPIRRAMVDPAVRSSTNILVAMRAQSRPIASDLSVPSPRPPTRGATRPAWTSRYRTPSRVRPPSHRPAATVCAADRRRAMRFT